MSERMPKELSQKQHRKEHNGHRLSSTKTTDEEEEERMTPMKSIYVETEGLECLRIATIQSDHRLGLHAPRRSWNTDDSLWASLPRSLAPHNTSHAISLALESLPLTRRPNMQWTQAPGSCFGSFEILSSQPCDSTSPCKKRDFGTRKMLRLNPGLNLLHAMITPP